MDVTVAGLCYLEASKVMGPTGLLNAFDVRTRHNRSLGSIDGVLIDPAARKLRFFVIEASGWLDHRRYLLPVEAAATMNPEGHSLRLEMETDDFTALDEFDMAAVREFTPEEGIAPTLFRYLA
jgi:PRC-barrel domain